MDEISVIDLFAGPGGLGEGFAARSDRFRIKLSLEVDPVACATLRLRKFFHLSRSTPARNSYYKYVRGAITLDELAHQHRELWTKAQDGVVNVELGDPKTRADIHKRIRKEIGRENFVLIGGPPCQAYSIIGRSRRLGVGASASDTNASRNRKRLEALFYSDPKHQLYREYLEIIAIHRPAVFVMENVKGLGSAKTNADDAKGGMFERIRADLQNPPDALRGSISKELRNLFGPVVPTRYRLFALSGEQPLLPGGPATASDFVIRCENYGVPQARHRIVILGIREDLEHVPRALHPQPVANVNDVLSGLPAIRSGVSRNKSDWLSAIQSQLWRLPHSVQTELRVPQILSKLRTGASKLTSGGSWTRWAALSNQLPNAALRWMADNRLGGVLQHEARSHMASDLVRYLYCAAYAAQKGKSPSLENWPTSLRPDHDNIKNDHGKLRPTGFSDRFKVQRMAAPSSTVTSHIAKDGHYYIHPDPTQCRSLTVREAARLQTFPDNYFFCGNRTQQYHQVGNAVPPFLAKQIAEVVGEVLFKD